MIVDVFPIADLPPGARKIVTWEDLEIGVFNCNGELLAIEDRCSHDDGPLAEGELDMAACTIECPRHGARFDIRTGAVRCMPATEDVNTYPVRIEGDEIQVRWS